MDATGIAVEDQPVPASLDLFVRRTRVRRIGTVRVPIAGPYCPRAHLLLLPDGRLLWWVRFWERDGPVPHLVPTHRLLRYARESRLVDLERDVVALVRSVGDRR